MSPSRDFQLDAFQVDVRELLSRTVANLYSHLVTRPTGRAVRLAIESQLQELDRPTLSLVDLSSVTVLDFSCADEVVAKLLLGMQDRGRSFVFFRGVRSFHRDPVEAVLERHGLRAVAQTDDGRVELLGPATLREGVLWGRVEERGSIPSDRVAALLEEEPGDRTIVQRLVTQRLVFKHPLKGDLLALSALSRALGEDRRGGRSRA